MKRGSASVGTLFLAQSTSSKTSFELWEKIMKRQMVLTIAVLIPAAAMAKGECQDDVQNFCKDVGEEKGAVVACLQQHMAELSEACKSKLSQQPRWFSA
jgi:Cysteine rich repeat